MMVNFQAATSKIGVCELYNQVAGKNAVLKKYKDLMKTETHKNPYCYIIIKPVWIDISRTEKSSTFSTHL